MVKTTKKYCVDVGVINVENVAVKNVVTEEDVIVTVENEEGRGVGVGVESVVRKKAMTAKEMVQYFQLNQARAKVKKESVSYKKKESSSRTGAKFTIDKASKLKFEPDNLRYTTSQEKGKQICKISISTNDFLIDQLSENERESGRSGTDEGNSDNSESVVVVLSKAKDIQRRPNRKIDSEEDKGGQCGDSGLRVHVDTDRAPVES